MTGFLNAHVRLGKEYICKCRTTKLFIINIIIINNLSHHSPSITKYTKGIFNWLPQDHHKWWLMINIYITDWRTWLLITDCHWSPPMITYDQFQWPSATKHTDGLVQDCSIYIANTLIIQGPISMKRCGLTSIEILMFKIRRSRDGLATVLSLMWESSYLVKAVFILRRGPAVLHWVVGRMVIMWWW